MNNWIGKKIEQNPQLQEFIEKSIGFLFNLCEEDDILEDLAAEVDVSTDELMWLFAQMEYKERRYKMAYTDYIRDILVRRDNINKEDAEIRIKECKRRLNEEAIPCEDYDLAEEIIADELGLEPDYMMDLLM